MPDGSPEQPALVTHCCIAPRHWDQPATHAPNPLTIIDGEWAYCPFGSPQVDGGHDWVRTKGVEYALLQRMREAPRDMGPVSRSRLARPSDGDGSGRGSDS